MTKDFSSLAPSFNACRCEHYAVVSLSGADAATFLHGQVSNDIEHLGFNEWTLAAYCNPKGRMIALFTVIRTGTDSFVLLMSREIADAVVQKLRMYVLRAKATFESTMEPVFGFPSRTAAEQVFANVPNRGKVVQIEEGLLISIGADTDRYLLVASSGAGAGIEVDAPPDSWLSILAVDAVPEVFAATTEAFLPQAVNLDLVGAVNFRKGCYPGQEIVARLRYLGKLKQRMVRIAFEGNAPDAGAALTAGGGKIGRLVLSGPAAAPGMRIGLASVNFGNLDRGAVAFVDGTPVDLFDTPYEVPELDGVETTTPG